MHNIHHAELIAYLRGRARLGWWTRFATYEQAQDNYASVRRGEAESTKQEEAGQLPLPLFETHGVAA